MDFSILLNKKIYAILIGDQNVFDEYSLPYLSGPDLCTLCSQFGLPRTYRWQCKPLDVYAGFNGILKQTE